MCAARIDAPVPEHDDLGSVDDGRKTVRDDKGGTAAQQLLQRVLHRRFGFGIEGGGGLVEDHDEGFFSSARAMEMRWRSPPERSAPRSPTIVSYPCGSRRMKPS